MKKNIIIAVLAILSVVTIHSTMSMSARASYWMNRCEAVIERVEEDNEDYVLDVLCESDAWCEWYEYCPGM